ncbi:MAG TPA: histidine kinase [Streptosporangiaceae bacterium]|nr:histidine kinase [Streptosporangiaceae bacterium]
MGPLTGSGAPSTAGTVPGYPFRGPGMFARVLPFGVVAVLAEASLALPPGPQSALAVVISIVLLVATAAEFLLPWTRLPGWMAVLIPLTYTSSVLALILAAGPTSGVGIVILIPLIWTALFHHRWESGCVVAAIMVVEVIISLTPVVAADAVIARRVLLWGSLGTLLSVAAHGLRERISRSQEESMRLQQRLREVSVLADRERIATDLRDKVIQQIFAAGLSLQGAASLTTEREVRRRLESSVADLDRAVRLVREAIFGLQHRMMARGLRQDVLDLCGGLTPVPEVTFSGPVDRALNPAARAELLGMLREVLGTLGAQSPPARISIAAAEDSCLAVVEASLKTDAAAIKEGSAAELSGLRDAAARAGARIDIEPVPGGARLALRFPVGPEVSPTRVAARP